MWFNIFIYIIFYQIIIKTNLLLLKNGKFLQECWIMKVNLYLKTKFNVTTIYVWNYYNMVLNLMKNY